MSSAASPMGQTRFLEALSAAHDGEAEPQELDQVLGAWRDDAEVRRTWHAWQLAADVMRSDDLAQSADHDEAFLVRLRGQLANEPVPLAPQALPLARRASSRWRRTWLPASAVAAGFVAVAGALVVTRNVNPVDETAPNLASAGRAADSKGLAVAGPLAVGNVVVVRNRELDQYLSAHRQFSPGPAIASPGGLRPVATSPDGR